MVLPAAYQTASGVDFGVPPAIIPADAYDSWLTVGLTDGCTGADPLCTGSEGLSSVGIDYSSWSTEPLTVQDGAVLWTNPDNGATGTAVIAQLTLGEGEYSATVNAQGQSSGDESDWVSTDIAFSWTVASSDAVVPSVVAGVVVVFDNPSTQNRSLLLPDFIPNLENK